ncbi:DUF362 domain-containing protein [candidate division KSB1 bacterium]|nr:DUF362 domain-containing protein [candidate division KSB1 bacterium]
MSDKINRRDFIKKSTVVGASSLLVSNLIPKVLNSSISNALLTEQIDLAAVTGKNYFNNAIKAVDLLGGMKKFVYKGSKVGLLINSPWRYKGAYTNPDIVYAVIKMCYEAGAKRIIDIKGASKRYWHRGSLAHKFEEEIKSIKSPGRKYVNVELPMARHLKEAKVKKILLDCDVFINIPIIKDHGSIKCTGSLKNMMGAAADDPTNRFMHYGYSGKNWRDNRTENYPFLSSCIADLCLVRKPDLCVCDATEVLVTNGPGGPGKLNKQQYVVASTDWVATDSYCARFLNLKATDILTLKTAHELGLGEIDITKLKIEDAKYFY